MTLRKISKQLNNVHVLKIPNEHERRKIQIILNSSEISSSIPLICFDIHLGNENQQKYIYFFKNIHPESNWYRNGIRDGDRLLSIDHRHVTSMPDDQILTIISEKMGSLFCEVIWHPELFLDLSMRPIERENISSQSTVHSSMTKLIDYLLTYRPKQTEQFSISFNEQEEIQSTDDRSLIEAKQFLLTSNQLDANSHTDEIMRNLLETNNSFERIGCGLKKEETYWIWLAMKNFLQKRSNVQKLRFWGKMFGLQHDYYIIETDFDSFDEFDLDDPEFMKYREEYLKDEENRAHDDRYSRTRKVPPELVGDGINQKLFFVTTEATEKFVQLPLLTPEQIEISRQIQRFFVGDLEAPVESFFPGVEKHLLRAHIQRISAGTQIGPKNYFHEPIMDEEEMEQETIETDDQNEVIGTRMRFDINPKFRGNQLEDLALAHGEYWVHCAPYIYQQGQTDLHRRSLVNEDTLRQSPAPLAPLNEDRSINHEDPAWSVKLSSTLVPEHALVSVRSNRWPGAYAVGDREQFKNIYIGWGLKTFDEHHVTTELVQLPAKEYEYELVEIDDPTVEEENFLLHSSIMLSPDDAFDNTSDLQ